MLCDIDSTIPQDWLLPLEDPPNTLWVASFTCTSAPLVVFSLSNGSLISIYEVGPGSHLTTSIGRLEMTFLGVPPLRNGLLEWWPVR